MAHLKPGTSTTIREYVWPVALGMSLAVCMPLIGIAAILLRGVLIGVLAAAVAAAACIGAWHVIEPSLSPRTRAALRTYAAPSAMVVALVVSLPLLAIIALVVQGTAAALAAAGLVMMGIVAATKLVLMVQHAHARRH